MVETWETEVGPAASAQRMCERRGSRILIYGEADPLKAHIVFARGRRILHRDSYSADATAIRRRGVHEPLPTTTRLAASSAGALVNEVSALAKGLAAVEDRIEPSEASYRLGEALIPVAVVPDQLVDQLYCWRAERLVADARAAAALELLKARLRVHAGPRVLRAAFHLLHDIRPETFGLTDKESEEHQVAYLRRAATFGDDPHHSSDLYNLAILLRSERSGGQTDEVDRLLTLLSRDPTYRHAWWVERLRGALAYGRAVHQQALGGIGTGQASFGSAGHHYSQALWLRHRSKRIERLGPAAPRFRPRSPVLHANAFDGHHFARHVLRAAWHRLRAQLGMRVLYRAALRGFAKGDFETAEVLLAQVIAVGWPNEMGVNARVYAAAVAGQFGADQECYRLWEAALQIDGYAARQLRAALVASPVSGLLPPALFTDTDLSSASATPPRAT